MGYDLHITRREHFADEGDDIGRDEWLAFVESAPELTQDAEGTPQLTAPDGETWRLWWFEGTIDTKNPKDWVVEKMVAIADQLGAEVQGDDGEVYRADGTSFFKDIAPEAAPAPVPAKPRGLFARLLGRG